VNIDTTYTPHIVSPDQYSLKKRLKAIAKIEGQDIDYGSPNFLHAELKSEIFTVTFTIVEKKLIDNQVKYSSHVLITLTGRMQESPKIGLYTWVDMAN